MADLDPIVVAFEARYGIRNLLDDLGMRKVHPVGKNQLIMCCDFHDERKESLSMNTLNGLWKCFGCNLQGNLYQFVARSYGLEYKQAVEFIAQRGGLADSNLEDILFLRDIQVSLNHEKESEEIIRWHNYTLEEVAVMYEGPDPYEYLAKRGFTTETIEYFECGFTSKWRGRDPDTDEVRYEPRIIIPGHIKNGSIAGFIARTPIDQTPKYRYSFGYHKAQTLFNLHRAKKYAHRGLIVVEGSLDVMKTHQFGYPNVVGSLGAKLSDEQIRLLCQTTDTVYLMFDGDKAGTAATEHAIEVLAEQLQNLYYIPLPDEYKDPDSIPNRETFDDIYNDQESWFAYNLLKEVN